MTFIVNFAPYGPLTPLVTLIILIWTFSTWAQKGNWNAVMVFGGFIVVTGIIGYMMKDRLSLRIY